VSTLEAFLVVYIVDIAILYDIESTSYLHCKPFLLFTSFTSSTLRCCTISNQHRVHIVNLSSCLHRSHRRHRDVVQHRINVVSKLETFSLVYIVHIVDIAMLYDIDSTSCRHSSCLNCSHRRHCDVVRYRFNIVSTEACEQTFQFVQNLSSPRNTCLTENTICS
jgi:hypothetical protein